MMRSLFSGVSGLKSHQTRMDVIGNNISNVNTVGFKSSRTTFAETLNQTLTGASAPNNPTIGGTNPKQIGLGTGVASIDMIFTDGSVQSTGKNTDLCLSGNGLFIVKQGNNTYYTRDGAFEFDAVGDYVLPGSGLHVQGWLREADGTIDTSDETKITDIVVPNGQTIDARQTTTASLTGNLNASSATGTALTTMIEVYASQGQHYSIPVVLEKTGTNAWSYKIQDNWKANDGTTATLAGKLSFDKDGKSTGTTTSTLTVKLTNGATTPITITLDTSKLTQVSAESTEHVEQDGYGAGKLLNISIDNQGIITGTYSNGVKRQEAQIAIAQFPNATGLTKSGNNLYQISNNSGSRTVGTNSALGVTITPSALEMSNTDIANEFADMIITQRGFQSNSKIITVGDEMLETLINMKR